MFLRSASLASLLAFGLVCSGFEADAAAIAPVPGLTAPESILMIRDGCGRGMRFSNRRNACVEDFQAGRSDFGRREPDRFDRRGDDRFDRRRGRDFDRRGGRDFDRRGDGRVRRAPPPDDGAAAAALVGGLIGAIVTAKPSKKQQRLNQMEAARQRSISSGQGQRGPDRGGRPRN